MASAQLLAALATAGQAGGNRESLFARNVSFIVERMFRASRNALANFMNCDHGSVSDWITRVRKPSLDSVLVLALRFTLPASRLLLEPLQMRPYNCVRQPQGTTHDSGPRFAGLRARESSTRCELG